MKDILNYGTTYKMFNIKKRELSQVRDFMLPDIKIRKSIREKNMRTKGDFLMINPYGKFRKFWNLILIVIFLYTAIVMPYKIALIDDSNFVFFIVDTIIDFLFMIDLFVNLNSPLVSE
jgi:hypothetical protein